MFETFSAIIRTGRWLWPLTGCEGAVPEEGDGAFGVRRKYDVHTGVDLYCAEGQEVRAIGDGVVLLISEFTGERAGSPWWNPTQAVVVAHGFCGNQIVVYGEIEPLPEIAYDLRIRRGQPLGKVLRVRKEAKGKPTTMLHLELWKNVEDVVRNYTGERARIANDWTLDGMRPKGLLDPTFWLKNAGKE